MITYFYWAVVILVAMSLLFLFGKADKWKFGLVGALVVLLIGWGAYYFHFEQIFVKRYGGVMSISVPKGQHHIAATWKDDNLWVENYDPETNTCHFNEYSKGALLQGKVSIKNCNPLMPAAPSGQMPNRVIQDSSSQTGEIQQ
ncbi:hypothetical protein [Hahella ganghwensis]|uniref:hypothetical protein n=1 Tax=Hahella ganghwensis TaxID=286420 RepID=UPI00037590C8|nr:hypothetical protein [Hahella ganghwensis]